MEEGKTGKKAMVVNGIVYVDFKGEPLPLHPRRVVVELYHPQPKSTFEKDKEELFSRFF